MNKETTPTNIDEFIELLNNWYNLNYHGFADKYNTAIKNIQQYPVEPKKREKNYNWQDADI